MNSFGERLRDLRKARGLTQRDLGEMLGKSDSAVRMWELGRNEPDMTTLKSLSSILGCSLEYLMYLEPSRDSTLKAPNDVPIFRTDSDFSAEPLRYITLPHEYFGGKSEYFGVLYQSSDMTPLILPNDCVIIRRQRFCP
ncbi:MAG: helix-turn-helix domain-containing protein [Acutalibacteraceae bacterium]